MRFIKKVSFVFLLIVLIPDLFSQSEAKINFNFNKTLLTEALNDLIYNSHVPLLYLKNQVDSIVITEQCLNCSQEEAINKLLKNSVLKIKKIKNQFILYNPKQDGFNVPVELEKEIGIKGIIVDSITNQPLPYATIVIEGINAGLASDNQGIFTINNLSPGLYKIKVVYMGYATDSIIADLRKPANAKFYHIKLTTKPFELKEVEVNTNISGTVSVNSDLLMSTLDPKELKTIPTLDPGDIIQNIKLIPGVTSMPDNLGGFNLRGGAVDQTLVQIDGIPLFHTGHLWGFNSSLNADAVESITIHSGGFSVRYGDRLSGVIDIKGKLAKNDDIHAGLFANLFSAKAYVALPVTRKANMFLSFNRSTNLFDVNNKVLDRNDYMFFNQYPGGSPEQNGNNLIAFGNVIPYEQKRSSNYHDIYGKLNIQASLNDSLSVSFISNYDKVTINSKIITDIYDPEVEGERSENWKTSGLAVNYSHNWNKSNKTCFGVIYSDYRNSTQLSHDQQMTEIVKSIFLNNNANYIKQLKIFINSNFLYSRNANLLMGLEYGQINSGFERYTYLGTDVPDINSKVSKTFSNLNTSHNLYGFAENTFTLSKRLIFTIGTRITYNRNIDLLLAEPRINSKITIGNGFWGQVSWGMFHQDLQSSPSCISYNTSSFGPTNIWFDSQKGLNPSRSQHWLAGLGYENKKWAIQLNAYYKSYSDLAFIIPSVMDFTSIQLEDSVAYGLYNNWLDNRAFLTCNHDSFDFNWPFSFPQKNNVIDYFTGSGHSVGIELFISKKKGIHTGFISYNLSSTSYQFPYINMGKEFAADYDRTHELKILNSLQFRGWNFGILYMLASGKPYTGQFKATSYYITSLLITEHPIKWDLNTTQRTTVFQTVDLSLSKKITLFKVCKLLIGASAYNIFNQDNKLSRYNSLTTNSESSFLSVINPQWMDQKGLRRMFNVFVNIEF